MREKPEKKREKSPEFFSGFLRNCINCIHNCEDHSSFDQICTLNNSEYDVLPAAHNSPYWEVRGSLLVQQGRGGGYSWPETLGEGQCGTLPETLTPLFQTKICGFPYSISDLIKNFIPYFRPVPYKINQRATSCYGTYTVSLRASSPIWAIEVSLARTRERGADVSRDLLHSPKYESLLAVQYTVGVNSEREMVLSPNDMASSKNKTYQIQDQSPQTIPYFRQKWSKLLILYFRPKRLKNHTLRRGTYLCSLYKGVPPPPRPPSPGGYYICIHVRRQVIGK